MFELAVFTFAAGVFVGTLFGGESENCPAQVLGYPHKNERCDHRKSVLYSNKLKMALAAEARTDGE